MQDFLVQLANESEIVRDYLGCKDWKNIVKITDNSVHRFVGMKDGVPQFQARIIGHRRDLGVSNILMRFAGDSVFKHLDRKYQYSESVMYQNTWKKELVKYASASFNPDAAPESTSVDGWAAESTSAEWATIRGDEGDLSNDSASTLFAMQISGSGTINEWDSMARGITLFDTSSIGAGNAVSSADYKLYGESSADVFSLSVGVVSSNPTINTAIDSGDYNSLGTTRYCDTDIAVSSWNTGGYNTFSLNATGKSAVDVSGITKIGTRSDADIDNSEPSYANDTGNAKAYSADNGSNEPTLDVTYAPAGGTAPFSLLMGVG